MKEMKVMKEKTSSSIVTTIISGRVSNTLDYNCQNNKFVNSFD